MLHYDYMISTPNLARITLVHDDSNVCDELALLQTCIGESSTYGHPCTWKCRPRSKRR